MLKNHLTQVQGQGHTRYINSLLDAGIQNHLAQNVHHHEVHIAQESCG